MKDKKARERIEEIECKLDLGADGLKILIRVCPKCKHETPQVKGDGVLKGGAFYGWLSHQHKDYDYLCLVCGSKLECITETTCKPMK